MPLPILARNTTDQNWRHLKYEEIKLPGKRLEKMPGSRPDGGFRKLLADFFRTNREAIEIHVDFYLFFMHLIILSQ